MSLGKVPVVLSLAEVRDVRFIPKNVWLRGIYVLRMRANIAQFSYTERGSTKIEAKSRRIGNLELKCPGSSLKASPFWES